MRKTLITAFALTAFLGINSVANAALLTPVSYGSIGGVNNTINLADGVFPPQGGQWQTNTAWWTGTTPGAGIDLGELKNIDDVLVSVDNNDSYAVEWSLDNSSWNNLFNISSSYGEIGWGMDTMSTDSTHAEYIAALDFSSVQARFLRIYATGGDNYYSVGELQAFGSDISAVPVPAAVFMFAPALLGFLGLRRKAKNTVA